MNPADRAWASCSVRAFRLSRSTARPASVTDRTTRLPSRGSGRRSTRPRASSAASVAPIDCGLICSSLASALGVAGPPRSRRARAELSGKRELALDLHLAQPPQQQADAHPERRGHLADVRIFAHILSLT